MPLPFQGLCDTTATDLETRGLVLDPRFHFVPDGYFGHGDCVGDRWFSASDRPQTTSYLGVLALKIADRK